MTGTIADINAFIAGSNLTFTTALNATANVNLTVTLNDGGATGIDPGLTGNGTSEEDTDVVTLTVTPVNDAPVLNGAGDGSSFTENGTSFPLDTNGNATISDLELDVSPNNYEGAKLTIARNGGPNAQDVFATNSNVDLSNSNGLGENVSLDSGVTFIGTFVDNGDGSISFTFNATATDAEINTVMRSILYTNVSEDPPASVQIDFTFSDGNGQPGGQAQGTGAAPGIAIGSFTVNITQINDRPEVVSVASNASYTIGSPGTLLSPALGVLDVDSNLAGGLAPDAIVNAVVKIQDFVLGDQLFVNLPTDPVGSSSSMMAAVPSSRTSRCRATRSASWCSAGTDTPGHYQQVLDAVNYRSTNPDPTVGGTDGNRTITWQVNDGTPVSHAVRDDRRRIATGVGPQSVATADLNGDGALDLVTANNGGTISVLLGSGQRPARSARRPTSRPERPRRAWCSRTSITAARSTRWSRMPPASRSCSAMAWEASGRRPVSPPEPTRTGLRPPTSTTTETSMSRSPTSAAAMCRCCSATAAAASRRR